MERHTYMKYVQAAAIGSIVASVLVAALTIVGEEWAPLKDWLKLTFTHHWLGKGVLAIVAFAVVTFWQEQLVSGKEAVQTVWFASGAAVLSALAMIVFFILHTLHLV